MASSKKTAKRRGRARRFFTLIELLVVIGIICILTSLLLPALKKSKEAVFCVSCRNNLRQVGAAYNSYAGDYNDWYPCYRTSSTKYWTQFLNPYLTPNYNESDPWKNWSPAFTCPAPPGIDLSSLAAYFGGNTMYFGPNSLLFWSLGTNNDTYVKMSRVKSASEACLLGHINTVQAIFSVAGVGLDSCNFPHFGGMNLLYFDAHTDFRRRAQIPNVDTDVFWRGK